MKENATLKNKNQVLRDTIRDLQHRFMTENAATTHGRNLLKSDLK